MQVKKMITPDQNVRVYTAPLNVTPTEGTSSMRSQAEIQHALILRAEELAVKEGYQGPGKFTLRHYKLAVAERPLSEQAAERGLSSTSAREPSQRERASKHYAQQVKTYMGNGFSWAEAIAKATEQERRSGLDQVRANIRNSRFAAQDRQERLDEADRFGRLSGSMIGNEIVRLHAAGSGPGETLDDNKKKTLFDEAARRIAADVMFTGETAPGQRHRNWAAAWYAVVNPPPAPLAGGGLGPIPAGSPLPTGRGGGDAALIAYNADLERTVREILESARTILRDPAKRAQLSPTRLGQ